MQLIEQSTNNPIRRRVLLHLVDATDGITPETGEAGTKCKVSLNYAAPADSANGLVAFDAVNAPGDYYLELEPREIKDPGMLVVRYKSANTAHFVQEAQVVAFNPDTWHGPLVGATGPDIDYKRIQKLISEAVGSIPAPKEAPEVDLKPVLGAIRALHVELASLEMPEPETVNLAPVMEAIDRCQKECAAMKEKMMAMKMPDMQPMMDVLEEIKDMKVPDITDAAAKIQDLLSKMSGYFTDDMEELKDGLQKIMKTMKNRPYLMIQQPQDDEPIQS